MDEFEKLFSTAFQNESNVPIKPFHYQQRMAVESWPDMLAVPTGVGKTAAVALSWLFKRGWRADGSRAASDPETPRRLVWCLPMRVLVEQTERSIQGWLSNLGILGDVGDGRVSTHLVMGGEDDYHSWVLHPEEDAVIVGTQDMLLSRALMRGYGMSRYAWPIDFALLHNDAFWVFDEVQLMGAALPTATQLDAFRRKLGTPRPARSLWLSATLNRTWLETVDMKPHLPNMQSRELSEEDHAQAGERLSARKKVQKSVVRLSKEASTKGGQKDYAKQVVDAVLKAHDSQGQTVVILNQVARAQEVFRELRAHRGKTADLLVHARFRPYERRLMEERIRTEPSKDRIIVATQAIEAGVDLSSKVLVTEIAPWSSLVQRFGRCNRYGEHNESGAYIYWVDADQDADVAPYTPEQINRAREKLSDLSDAKPKDLPSTDEERELTPVIRKKDFLDLFNTDPDLSGFDVDVSDYIRDTGAPSFQVFWRDMEDPNDPSPQPRPERQELCSVPISERKNTPDNLWRWDPLSERWAPIKPNDIRPGNVCLARTQDGRYDPEFGFDPSYKKPVPSATTTTTMYAEDGYSQDYGSTHLSVPVPLTDHLEHVAGEMKELCVAVEESEYSDVLIKAGWWHDVGKAHPVFDQTMHACDQAPKGYLAKSTCNARHSRPNFRHELASMLAWLETHDDEASADLVAYVIAAHHGKVRTGLRALPTETVPEDGRRFARGIWEGDQIPALKIDGELNDKMTLRLALMEMGYGEQGPSWALRTSRLMEQYGPFRLAWLETLLRLADWRASKSEQLEDEHG